jgi:hypothetical protein
LTTGEDFPSRLDRAVDASNKAQLIEAKAERVEERCGSQDRYLLLSEIYTAQNNDLRASLTTFQFG